MKVNICGLPYNVIQRADNFKSDGPHLGECDFTTCTITINNSLPPENYKETLCHEMVHAMLFHMGYSDLSLNEQFVQALGNAIYQGFDVKEVSK